MGESSNDFGKITDAQAIALREFFESEVDDDLPAFKFAIRIKDSGDYVEVKTDLGGNGTVCGVGTTLAVALDRFFTDYMKVKAKLDEQFGAGR